MLDIVRELLWTRGDKGILRPRITQHGADGAPGIPIPQGLSSAYAY